MAEIINETLRNNGVTVVVMINGVIFFSFMLWINKRFVASKKLGMLSEVYRVRDQLILLIAEGKLKEESPVFQYYYIRVSDVLELHPNIPGLHNLLEILVNDHTGNFRRSMKKSDQEYAKLLEHEDLQNKEVQSVVRDYYEAIFHLVLSHSDLVRAMYWGTQLASKRIAGTTLNRLGKVLSKIAEDQVEGVKTLYRIASRQHQIETLHN